MQRIEPPPSFVIRTAESLREALNRMDWAEYLPGERILSRQLGVSRPTLRAALKILEDQKWIHTEPGRRRKILRLGSMHRSTGRILLLSREPESELPRASLLYVDYLRAFLRDAGWQLDFHYHPLFARSSPRLGGLLPRPDAADCFILFSLSSSVQKLFQEKNYPAVVVGSASEGVRLPALDIDYASAMRHAVGHLLARGRQNIVLFLSDSKLPGDQLTERGFLQAARQESKRCHAKVVRHLDDPSDIRHKLSQLLRSRESDSLGIIASRTLYALTLLSGLQRAGKQVPRDVSLICRDSDPMLDWTSPPISRYRISPERFALQLTHIVTEIARGRKKYHQVPALIPEFLPGKST